MPRPPFRSILFAAALAALPILAGCDSPEERAAAYVADGEARLAADDVDRAAIHFRNALRIEPKNASALLGMGRVHERREHVARAYTAYREAASADPSLVEAHAAYGVMALTGGRLDEVREAIDGIRAVDPDHPDGLALAAAVALRDDELDRAEDLAQAALATAPGHVNATSALAGVANARGEPRAAARLIDERSAAHGPSVPLALLKIQLLGRAGDEDGVIAGFEEAIAAAPGDVSLRLALADFHRRNDRPAAAEAVLRDAVAHSDAPETAMAALVRLVARNGGLDAALAEVDRLQENVGDPDHELTFLAADLLAEAGRLDEAGDRLRSVVEAVPEDGPTALDARAGLAGLAQRAGEVDRARRLVEEVLAADPEHRGANFLRASLHLAAGEVREAVASVRAALAQAPDWTPGLRLLARAHLVEGERDLAIETLTRVVRAEPTDLESAEALARLLAERGDSDRALAVWDHVIAGRDDPSEALANTAQLAIGAGDWNRASADIERLLATPEGQLSGTLLAGSLSVARGDTVGGREWFAEARRLDPEGPAPLFGLVRSHLAEDDVDGALAVLDEELGARPDNAVAHQLVAKLERDRGDAEAAAVAYRRAIAAAPNWAGPYRELADLLARGGAPEQAVAVLDGGIAAGAAPADLRLRKAFVLQGAGAMTAAIEVYAGLLDDGDSRDIVVNNYAALVADHAFDDGAKMARALDLAARFATSEEAYFVDTLGWLYHRHGEPGRAVALLRRAAAMRPDDPQIRYHLGAALAAAGSPDEALVALEQATGADAAYPGVVDARALADRLTAERARATAAE